MKFASVWTEYNMGAWAKKRGKRFKYTLHDESPRSEIDTQTKPYQLREGRNDRGTEHRTKLVPNLHPKHNKCTDPILPLKNSHLPIALGKKNKCNKSGCKITTLKVTEKKRQGIEGMGVNKE